MTVLVLKHYLFDLYSIYVDALYKKTSVSEIQTIHKKDPEESQKNYLNLFPKNVQ